MYIPSELRTTNEDSGTPRRRVHRDYNRLTATDYSDSGHEPEPREMIEGWSFWFTCKKNAKNAVYFLNSFMFIHCHVCVANTSFTARSLVCLRLQKVCLWTKSS